jgi:hypothetical protein
MSNKKAVIAFADAVLQHFPPFRWDEHQEKAWAETIVRELGGFSGAVVDRAAREIIRTRKKPQTPMVSECIAACSEARKWVESEDRAAMLTADRAIANVAHLDWTAERLKLASELMNTSMGKQAAKEGWVGALWSFVRKNSRLPKQDEIASVKQAAKGFDEAYAKVVGDLSPLGRMLEKLGAEMLRRRRATERRLLS